MSYSVICNDLIWLQKSHSLYSRHKRIVKRQALEGLTSHTNISKDLKEADTDLLFSPKALRHRLPTHCVKASIVFSILSPQPEDREQTGGQKLWTDSHTHTNIKIPQRVNHSLSHILTSTLYTNHMRKTFTTAGHKLRII